MSISPAQYGQAAAILIEARQLLSDGHWCQGYTAIDLKGERCSVEFGEKFCASGAYQYVTRSSVQPGFIQRLAWEAVLMAVAKHTAHRLISKFNDQPGRTEAEVLELFDQAILLLVRREVVVPQRQE